MQHHRFTGAVLCTTYWVLVLLILNSGGRWIIKGASGILFSIACIAGAALLVYRFRATKAVRWPLGSSVLSVAAFFWLLRHAVTRDVGTGIGVFFVLVFLLLFASFAADVFSTTRPRR